MSKYLRTERAVSHYVSIRLLDEAGKTIVDHPMAGCHGVITRNMDTRTACVNVYRSKAQMPFDLPEIQRWVTDLNAMGFPCSFLHTDTMGDDEKQARWSKETMNGELDVLNLAIRRHGMPAPVDLKNCYNFYVYLKDFESKNHLFSTLQLLRYLYETSMCRALDNYFEAVDAKPDADKFQILQDVQKDLINGYSHAVTFKGNGKNITHEELMKRLKVKSSFFSGDSLTINQAWNGGT